MEIIAKTIVKGWIKDLEIEVIAYEMKQYKYMWE